MVYLSLGDFVDENVFYFMFLVFFNKVGVIRGFGNFWMLIDVIVFLYGLLKDKFWRYFMLFCGERILL